MIIYLVENVSQKPRNSLMQGRVRGMLRYQVPRLFRCKFRKKMQEKQEECEIIHFSHLYFVNLPQNKQLSLK